MDDSEEPIIDLHSDAYFMGQALREARKAYSAGEVPVGAVVVREGRVIARAWNQVETLKDATAHVRERVMEGTDIATPLKKSGAFPPTVGYMVAVGEQSGEVEQMLDRIAIAYDEEIEVAADRFTSLLEPLMIVFLAAIVGYIVFGIVQPILEIGQL